MFWGNPVIFTDCGDNPMITIGKSHDSLNYSIESRLVIKRFMFGNILFWPFVDRSLFFQAFEILI